MLNLGANFLGSAGESGVGAFPMEIKASGVASSALNFIGNRNSLTSSGVLANSTVVGNFFGFPNGSDNTVTSTGPVSVAFVRQGLFSEPCSASRCGNTVASGPFSIAGAFNTIDRIVTAEPGNRINIAFPFNNNGTTASTFAAPTTFANGSSNGSGGGAALTKSSKQFSSSLKKLSDGVKNALGGLGKKKQDSEPKTDS